MNPQIKATFVAAPRATKKLLKAFKRANCPFVPTYVAAVRRNIVWPRLSTSVDWQTPPEIIKALGKFDLDPCASTRQAFRTARTMWTRRQDGRTRQWFGRAWLNPPFDYQLPVFVKLMADHNNGIALLPVNLTTNWWKQIVWTRAHSILFLYEKLHFYRGKKQDLTPRSHMDRSEAEALVAFGAKNTTAIRRSGIGGQLVYGGSW